jgi:SAM-dependent methyltransferase
LSAGSQSEAKNALSCKELLANIKHNERIIRKNVFTTERGLEFYKYLLGREFKARVRKLGPRHHWIDVGAGEANAMFDLFIGSYLWNEPPLEILPNMTAITVTEPRVRETKQRKAFLNFKKFNYLVGKYLQNYKTCEIPKADLVTDVMGAANYSPDFDVAMCKILRLLKPGGTAIVTFMNKQLEIRDSSGRRVSNGAYIRMGRGFNVEKVRVFDEDGTNHYIRFTIRRTKGRITLPPLKLVRLAPNYDLSTSPDRDERIHTAVSTLRMAQSYRSAPSRRPT